MRLARFLQHWLSGTGTRLQVTDFVPEPHPIRQWADTFPWTALVMPSSTVSKTVPHNIPRGRRPVPIRVLFALELLKHELGASDEDICQRLRTDLRHVCLCLRDYQVNPSQAHFVLPETLCEFRSRIDETLMDELIAIQAAVAMEEGCQPAHLVIDTFPCEQGSQRVTDAPPCIRLKKRSADCTHTPQCRSRATTLTNQARASTRRSKKSCAALAANAEARARLRETGAPTEQKLRSWENHHCAWAAATATPCPGDGAQRRHTRAFRRGVQRGDAQPCAHPPAIHTAHSREKAPHCKLVNAYDLTIAPILKGKSNCPRSLVTSRDRVGSCHGLSLCQPCAEGIRVIPAMCCPSWTSPEGY